ncbi:MAG: metal-dependent phosphohydrolase [Proteobacteria bacterium]|nr:MAG: metal-dependent phosphohydrolase [Pseudomonadota bacterium]
MTALLNHVYRVLDIAIFTREADGLFHLQSPLPDWLLFFVGHASRHAYDLLDIFPYLHCFIFDAEQQWQAKKSEPIASGPWLEVNAVEEVPLEANALWVEGKEVLLLQNLGEKYYREVEHLQYLRNGLLNQEILESEVRKRTLEIQRREEEIAIKLVSLTSYRDEETGSHVRRIGLYAAAMARALNWSRVDVDNIRIAASMHDIGKIGIPDRILRKNGALNDEEFSMMKTHTEIGARMLLGSNIPMLDMAADIALHHHERWDGTGYPNGLAGEAIPVAARITSIVDIYDALVHERVYKTAIPEDESIALMKDMSGRHLDPNLLDLFLHLLPVMRQIRNEVKEQDEETIAA